MGGVWVGAWALLGLTGLAPGGAVAVLGVLTFMAVFAFGETLLQPTVPAICNDLAPDHLRGRYNAINAAAFQAGTIAGPAVAGVLLQHHLEVGYVGLLVLGCAAIAAIALVLERRISPEVNGLRAREQTVEVT
jgi:MFS family permease